MEIRFFRIGILDRRFVVLNTESSPFKNLISFNNSARERFGKRAASSKTTSAYARAWRDATIQHAITSKFSDNDESMLYGHALTFFKRDR